jgi:hypothetical protein
MRTSAIVERVRGRGVAPKGPVLPPSQDGARPPSGVNPLLVVAVALATGVAAAKWLDWRGHAHPRG